MKASILSKCQKLISYQFSDPKLLKQALTHSSAARTRQQSNERLEFLGDAVLAMVICHDIYASQPDLSEGGMTKVKSSVVSRQTCAQVARRLGLTELMTLGKGVASWVRLPSSLDAAVFEAIIGAIYLDGGLAAAREFILDRMDEELDAALASEHQRNYKSVLQQHAQQRSNSVPQYELLDEKGPEHDKCFEVAVRLNGRQFPGAWGNSKKQAEQKAALAALLELGVVDAPGEPDDPAGGRDDPA